MNYTSTDEDFIFLQHQALEKTGISLSPFKKDMLFSRLALRLRVLNISSFSQYCRYLESGRGSRSELPYFINAVTTNFTSFFREKDHFDFLFSSVIPSLMCRDDNDIDLSMWSAGCSTGEEAYSMAIAILEAADCYCPSMHRLSFNILATDIDTDALAVGREALYDLHRLRGLSQHRIDRWCEPISVLGQIKIRLSEELQQYIDFERLNLFEAWPMDQYYDIIFCRNVIIYFDTASQKKVLDRFYQQLNPGGYLFIGPSESLKYTQGRLDQVSSTIYRKS